MFSLGTTPGRGAIGEKARSLAKFVTRCLSMRQMDHFLLFVTCSCQVWFRHEKRRFLMFAECWVCWTSGTGHVGVQRRRVEYWASNMLLHSLTSIPNGSPLSSPVLVTRARFPPRGIRYRVSWLSVFTSKWVDGSAYARECSWDLPRLRWAA